MSVIWIAIGVSSWVMLVIYGNLSEYRSLKKPHPMHESNDYGENHKTS